MSLHPHAHWVWSVRFHPVHDQLLLTGGSDASVVLSCAQSVSSEQQTVFRDEDDEDEEEETDLVENLQDGQLERIDEHEDSVVSAVSSRRSSEMRTMRKRRRRPKDDKGNLLSHVAGTVEQFITLADALRLNTRAVDDLFPGINDLVSTINASRVPIEPIVHEKLGKWKDLLSTMSASSEISEDETRQMNRDVTLNSINSDLLPTSFYRFTHWIIVFF